MNRLEFGDCRDIMRRWAAEGIKAQTCVTSPPYFGLRDYGHEGQIGLEQTPEEYIAAMVDVFRCVRDVLADDGTLWLNIGDSYARNPAKGQHKPGDSGKQAYIYDRGNGRASSTATAGLPEKNLIGIPWRLAFALQADGWILRQDIIWHKPNPMPESVRDRCTKAHEYLFLLSKSPRYFYDSVAIEEPARWERWGNQTEHKQHVGTAGHLGGKSISDLPIRDKKNRRSVWSVSTRPYKGAHFATFPPALIEPCILAGTSERGHCPACGAGWQRQMEVTDQAADYKGSTFSEGKTGARDGGDRTQAGQRFLKQHTGWKQSCKCPAHTPVAATVLDPFMGSGTTAATARQLGRRYLGCELNSNYEALQLERIASATPRQQLTLAL